MKKRKKKNKNLMLKNKNILKDIINKHICNK